MISLQKQTPARHPRLTETISNRTSGEASQRTAGLHSAFTYGNLLWRDLKGIKMRPGRMT